MTTRADLRAKLRVRLEDPTPNPLWSDAMLHDFLQEALHRYSARFPGHATETVAAAGGELELPLAISGSERDIVRVRRPDGSVLPRSVDGDRASGWSYWNGALRFSSPAAAGDWTIDVLVMHAFPNDDLTVLELPDSDEEVLVLFAASAALLRRSVEVGKRGLDSASLALVRVADAYERSATSLVRARMRRAYGSTFQMS